MKRRLPLALVALLTAIAPLQADEANIKVTSVLHPDGSRTETVTNFAEGTSEERVVSAANKLIRRTAYTLDTEGRTNGGVIYGPDDRPVSRFQLVRDSFGNITEQRDYTVKGEVVQRRIFRLDAQGKVIGVDTYDNRGVLIHTTGSGSRKQQRR